MFTFGYNAYACFEFCCKMILRAQTNYANEVKLLIEFVEILQV